MPARRALVAACALLLAACARSHLRDGEPSDASAPPRVDAAPPGLDAGPRDAGPRDAGPPGPDAGPPSPSACPGFGLLDRVSLPAAADSCSRYDAPRIVVSGATFELVHDETRFCDDRPGFVSAQPLAVVGSRIEPGTPRVLLPASGGSAEAAGGSDGSLAVCEGLRFARRDALGGLVEAELAPEPMSLPGCPMRYRCDAIARHDGGWLAFFDLFECDVSGFEWARYDDDGARLTPAERTYERIVGATTYDAGAAWISRPRGDRASSTVWRWPNGSSSPSPVRIPVDGEHGDVTPWPFAPDALALVYARTDPAEIAHLTLIVLDGAGDEVLRRELRPFAGVEPFLFGGPVVRIATTTFGVVISTRVSWGGGADRGGLSVLAVGQGGAPLGSAFVEFEGGFAEHDVAALGEHTIVHQGAGEQTEALLFGCR